MKGRDGIAAVIGKIDTMLEAVWSVDLLHAKGRHVGGLRR